MWIVTIKTGCGPTETSINNQVGMGQGQGSGHPVMAGYANIAAVRSGKRVSVAVGAGYGIVFVMRGVGDGFCTA